jgi:HEAT repeat protein
MRVLLLMGLATGLALGQSVKDVRSAAKLGTDAIPLLDRYLNSTDPDVRLEAVKGLAVMGNVRALDPLIRATKDNDAQVQERAVEGLVNYYLPGYVPSGRTAPIRRLGSDLKSRISDTNTQVLDPFVMVRPDVVPAIGRVASAGTSIEARTAAARALGILHGREALPDLISDLRLKDSTLMYEAVIALQKIRDPDAGAALRPLLRDSDKRVQLAAIETTGALHYSPALPDLEDVLRHGSKEAAHAALTAIALMADPSIHDIFMRYFGDPDEQLRTAAAEGVARLANADDLPAVEKAFAAETRTPPRLALAFAEIMEGQFDYGEFSALRYVVYNLNSAANRAAAYTYLTESTARFPELNQTLYQPMEQGTRDEKINLARVLAQSGDRAAEAHLDKISHDTDPAVAEEGIRALRVLRAK